MSRTVRLLLCLGGCWGGAPAQVEDGSTVCPAIAASPDLATLTEWLVAAGDKPTERAGALIVERVIDGKTLQLTVQIDGATQVVYLATSGLLSLDDALGDAGVVSLLTHMAALNYEYTECKLALNAATGEVVLSLELETDDGLGQTTFDAAMLGLTKRVGLLLPKLLAAAKPTRP